MENTYLMRKASQLGNASQLENASQLGNASQLENASQLPNWEMLPNQEVFVCLIQCPIDKVEFCVHSFTVACLFESGTNVSRVPVPVAKW